MCDMPEPRKFQFLVPAEFLWTHKEVDLAPHPVFGLVLQEDMKSFLKHLGLKAWIFFSISKQVPSFTAIEEDQDDKRLVQPELACNVDGVVPPDPV